MLFEGRCLSSEELVQKATQEANEWYAAQAVEEEWSKEEMISRPQRIANGHHQNING